MWMRCLVIIAFIIAVPWTIADRLWRSAVMLWFDLRADFGDEWRAAKRCWRNKSFD